MHSMKDLSMKVLLPASISQDKQVIASCEAIDLEMKKLQSATQRLYILPNIDNLDNDIVDLLARQFNAPYYDSALPLPVKRSLVKGSINWHKIKGTLAATEGVISALYGEGAVEEWHEYGGEPFHFRLILETFNKGVQADIYTIVKAIDTCKRKSAHLDSVIYQCNLDVKVETEEVKTKYSMTKAGQVKAGELPQRNRMGEVRHGEIDIEPVALGSTYNNPQAGTQPQRNRIGHITHIDTETNQEIGRFMHMNPVAGTIPQRNRMGTLEGGGIGKDVESDAYEYKVKKCGVSICGR